MCVFSFCFPNTHEYVFGFGGVVVAVGLFVRQIPLSGV